jgi:short-subunit dehydrogenase
MMRVSLQGRVVLVTGASSGIGALTARLLADRGAIPVLTARSSGKLRELAASFPGEHAVYAMDVTDNDQVQHTVTRVIARYGKLDILLNNAGYGEFVSFAEASLEHFRDMMDVNYMGVVRCAKAVLPYMTAAGQGHIVNVASLAGKIGTSKSSAYTATKHAVIGLTESLRQELRGTGIVVSSVNPGPIDTPFFERADPEGTYLRNIGWFVMKPDKVARAIVDVMERRLPEKDLPWLAAAGVRLRRVFPRWTDAVSARLLDKK